MATYFRPGTYALVPNKHLLPEMKGAPLSVYITLCSHADTEGICFPGIKRIMAMSGYNKDSVFTALKKLIELGVIERTKRKSNLGNNDTNLYRILIVDDVKGSPVEQTTYSKKPDYPGTVEQTRVVRYTGPELTHELTHVRKDDIEKTESSKRIDHRGEYSPTAERMRSARQKGLKPWEVLTT